MTKENYISTQNLDQKIQKLVIENKVIFIKFKYYTVLEEMIKILDNLQY